MRTNKEIVNRIHKMKKELQLAEESYFSIIEEKREGKEVSNIDFLKIENEYELLKKEHEILLWILKIEE